MEQEAISELIKDLDAFHMRFHSFFARPEPRLQSSKYLKALIQTENKRNTYHIAESIGDSIPDKTQRLLYRANWDHDGVCDELQKFSREEFGSEDGVFIIDETGFIKRGNFSIGVQRQYSGTAGKTENCQIGVFLGYSSSRGKALLGRALYVPEVWFENPGWLAKADAPKDLVFLTKPQLAFNLLAHSSGLGFPGAWVTADEVYGNSDEFRSGVGLLGLRYVLAVKRCLVVTNPMMERGKGRPALSFWEPGTSRSVEEIACNLPINMWKKLTLRAGEKGPIQYWWAAVRVLFGPEKEEGWLLIRRSVKNRDDMAFYFSNAEQGESLAQLATVAATRFEIELCFEEAKGQAGLDEYECRRYHSWYRHITLSMMAYAFLSARKKNFGQNHSQTHPKDPHDLASYTTRFAPLGHGMGKLRHPKEGDGKEKPMERPILQKETS